MYSKVYWIGCKPDQTENMLAHYDSVMTPAIQASEYHAGHQMLEAVDGKYLLVSNYHDKKSADAAVPLVQELVKPMAEKFGMTLDIITESDVLRSI